MDDRYQYVLLLAACLAITLPLEFVFAARVYRRPARLVRALLPMLVLFVAWDVIALSLGHWSFNERYTTGIDLPLGLPLEELLFFVVIPICALLTYEAVGTVLRWARRGADRA